MQTVNYDNDIADVLVAVRDAAADAHERFRAMAEHIFRDVPDAGTETSRALLRRLYHQGPATVPQLARARAASRQSTQSLVDALFAAGRVELIDNPAHRRSRLVRLTDRGTALVESLRERELQLLSQLKTDMDRREMRDAVRVLQRVSSMLDSPAWDIIAHEAGA